MNNNNLLVSIIINNYNYELFLSEAIRSALDQTYSSIEVIVVDDGSTDNSRDVILSYGDRIVPVFKENGGQASALNAGFISSKGEIICFLDADDLFLPQKVSEVVNLFLSKPDIDWVFTESAPFQSEDLVNKNLNTIFKEIIEASSVITPRNIDFRLHIRKAELPNFTPSTSNLCFSRLILEKIFPLPEVSGSSGIAICDTYLKLVAVALGEGYSYPKNLGIFRLHNSNLFTTQELQQKRQVFAEILIATAYWILFRFPHLRKLSKKLFSKGLGTYWQSRKKANFDPSFLQLHAINLSLFEKIEVQLMSLYYFFKLYRKDFV